MDLDELQIKIDATSKDASAQVDQLVKKLSKLSVSLGKINGKSLNSLANNASKLNRTNPKSTFDGITTSAKKASKSTWSLAAAFGKFYASYFMVIRGAKSLWKSIEGTTDYIEAFNYYAVSFNKIGKEWQGDFEKYGKKLGYSTAEEYATSFAERVNEKLGKMSGLKVNVEGGLLEESGMKNLGLNIQEITQYASQLASVTNSLGQTGETTTAITKSMTMLAGDISSLFNVDYSTVANNLQSGLIGQSRALYKYGIDITNATLATYAYNLGISKSVAEMSQAEKQQLRFLAILDQSRVSWGDLANTINSPSNMIRQFSNNVKEAGMVLGQLFIPILTKIMPIVNGVTIAIKRLLVSIATLFGVKIDFDSFGNSTADISSGFDDVSDSLDGVTSSAKKAKASIRGWDELNNLTTPTSSSGSGSTGGAIDLTQEIMDAAEAYEKAWQEAFDKMQNKAIEIANKIENALEPVKKLFSDISIGDWFAAGGDVSSIVSGIFNFFSNAISKVNWRAIGTSIGEFLAGIDWSEVLSSIGNFIWQAINAAIQTWSSAFVAAPIETTIITTVAALHFTGLDKALIGALTKPLLDGVVGALASISGSSSIIAGIAGLFTTDLGLIFGAGTFAEIATTFAAGLSSAILVAWAGYNIGLSIREIEINGVPLGEYVDGAVDDMVTTWQSGMDIINKKTDEFSDNWETGWEIISDTASDTWDKIVEFFTKSIPKWWNDNISPWFTEEKWKKLFDKAKEGLKKGWNTYVSWFDGIAIVKWWNKTKGYFTKDKWTFEGIKKGLQTAWDNAISAVKETWNKFAGWLNDRLTWTIDPVVVAGKTIFGGTTLNLGKIPTFETGGYVPRQYSLFMAGENGVPEIAGTVGGKTAVAGGAEITGIRDAVYETGQQELAELREQNQLLRALLNKEFGISKSDIGKASREYAKDYYNRTGREAYSF